MSGKELISLYKPQLIFVAKVALIYLLLYLSVTFYIGLTAEGGFAYSPWIEENLNFVDGLRYFLLRTSQMILEAIGYDTYRGEYTLGIRDQGGIRLVYKCLGFELTFGYIALVLAYPFQGIRTWLYLVFGIILIQFLNVVRIFWLTIQFTKQDNLAFEVIDHHDLFNIVVVLVLLVVYRFFLLKAAS